MTHDFAKKPKAASKNKKKKKPTKTQVPGWVWLFTGLAAGLLISFLGYLAGIAPESEPNIHATANKSIKSTAKSQKLPTTKFDFYTLLPEREVIVPVEQEHTAEQPAQAFNYILQAGSFKNSEDADRLRAQLILMDLEVRIDPVTSNNGDLWHRVQVGPFQDRSKLSRARSILISNGIDTLLLRRKVEN